MSNENSNRMIDNEYKKKVIDKKNTMFIIKRSGEVEPVFFDKITARNEKLCEDLDIDTRKVSQKVIDSMKSGMKTRELDILSAETALYMSTDCPEYEILAKRIAVSNLHKDTKSSFSEVTEISSIYNQFNEEYLNFVRSNSNELDGMIVSERDYDFTYFGFKTLEKAYLLKDNDKNIIERPQHLFMRVATFLRMPDMNKIKSVYDGLSLKYFIHASPTLFNCGMKNSQLSSCFLLSMNDDLNDMLGCVKNAGMISKWSGGIGIDLSNIRCEGSKIKGTNGESSGIIPFVKLWNDLARYVNQGGKRKGAIATYIEPHTPDIINFLKLKKNNTDKDMQCLDIHLALWVSDLFMKRLKENGVWSFFDPAKVKLHDVYGEEYEKMYLEAEKNKLYEKQINISELWKEILSSQMETGEPYILFKDHINRKSNQMNRGVIKCSNLCTEIVEYCDNDNYAVCNLSSISLPSFVEVEKTIDLDFSRFIVYTKLNCKWCDKLKSYLSETDLVYFIHDELDESVKNLIPSSHKTFPIVFVESNLSDELKFIGGYDSTIEFINNELYFTKKTFNYKKLGEVSELVTENLNIIIDKNYYPVIEASRSNFEMRPIGIGIQGLADTLQMLDLAWEDDEAKELNRNIFAVIQYHALKKSMELAIEFGSYSYFKGSPASKGILQHDLWGKKPVTVNGLLDWEFLKTKIMKNGLRNSLLTTQMPTASTSQILGNNESIEPYTTNLYTRKVICGSFPIVNKHLYNHLNKIGLWNKDIIEKIMRDRGSIQEIEDIPQRVKDIYKTAWELSSKLMIEYSADRGVYIDQTQSFNVFMKEPTMGKLSTMFMMGWSSGLKTGMYYLRRRPKLEAIQFSLKNSSKNEVREVEREETEECISCSS
jgi:ribonucleoside-diphosphate reductase alpha subunit